MDKPMTTKEAVEIAKEKVGWINVQINYHKKILEFNPKNLKSHNDFIYYTELKEALSHLISIAERVDEGKILDILEENTKEQKGGMGNYCGCSITSIGEATKQIVNYLEGR